MFLAAARGLNTTGVCKGCRPTCLPHVVGQLATRRVRPPSLRTVLRNSSRTVQLAITVQLPGC